MQMALIQQLQDQAAGKGPSLAQMQLQKATDQNMASAMALGASQRGAGQAGMLRGIQNQQAGLSRGMAADSGILQLQEQMQARQMLGQNLGGMRGQDLGASQMGLGARQFDVDAQNRAGQFNVTTQQTSAESARERQQRAVIEQAKLDMEMEKMRLENAKQNSPAGMVGGILSAVSDARLKDEIRPGEAKLYEFLDKLGSHEYKYKDSKHGAGRRISPMAQELEKSEAGKKMVFEFGEGKAVDYGKGLGTMLASQAALHKRLKALEGK
jgi:hypothetical protein